jgi:hypothetical protein
VDTCHFGLKARHRAAFRCPWTLKLNLANTASKFCSVRRVSFETSIHAGGAVVEATRRLPFCTQRRRPSTSAAMPPRLCSHPSNCAKFWCGIGEVDFGGRRHPKPAQCLGFRNRIKRNYAGD